MRKKSTLTFVLALAFAFVAFGGYVVVAEQADSQESEVVVEETASAEEPAPLAGMTVSIDPETGEFRAPTAEEAAAFAAEMRSRFAETIERVPVTHPNGMVSVELSLEHMDFSVAHKGDDGKLHLNCVDDHADAVEAIATQTAQPEKE